MPSFTRLKLVPDLTHAGFREQVERNLIDFFQWAFLEAGGFSEVPVWTPGTAYGDEALFPVQQDGVADGRVWQARRAGWVYETGLESGLTPTVNSGVYVNGTLVANSATGAYKHRVDFPRGVVTFDAAIPAASVVQAAFSYRWANFYNQDTPWFRPVVLDGFLTEQSQQGGVLAVLDRYRVSTPFAVVETTSRSHLRGYELGSGSFFASQDVLFHAVASEKGDRDRLLDAITLQQDRAIFLYDVNARRAAGDFPLDARGAPVSGANNYPAVVAAYPWKKAWLTKADGQDVSAKLPLFRGVARLAVEAVV